jgi:hypothetical protein
VSAADLVIVALKVAKFVFVIPFVVLLLQQLAAPQTPHRLPLRGTARGAA